ncbi:hypothetical protein ACJZ2D_006333 [Fusarium nematophilum]
MVSRASPSGGSATFGGSESINEDASAGPRDAPLQRRQMHSAIDHASKRRASKACLSCRQRKVRCDVETDNPPCTNCRLDGVSCITKKSNRGRRPAVSSLGPGSVAARWRRARPATPTPPVPRPSLPPPSSSLSAAASPAPPSPRQSQNRLTVAGTGANTPNEFFPSLYFEGKSTG